MARRTWIAATVLAVAATGSGAVRAAESAAPLQLVDKIPLGAVSGRIDHMAIDAAHSRLFVAELGNGSVSVIDLAARKVAQRLTGLSEPQGVGFDPASGTLVIANGGDGSVRLFRGSPFAQAATVSLKHDADNVRLTQDKIWVGYGSGGLGAIDPATGAVTGEIALKAHPEGFQIDLEKARAYVNVPDANEIAVLDLSSGRQIAGWHQTAAHANFPMTLLENGARVAVGFRTPARIAIFDAANGTELGQAPLCGDTDDIPYDPKRHRLYAVCGAGTIDVFRLDGETPSHEWRIVTESGARTGLFDVSGDKLYVGVRARDREPAAIWVYAPQ